MSSCHFYGLRATGQNIRYSGVNCVLGPSKSIRHSGDFVIAGFVIAGFVIAGLVSTYFTVILPCFHTLFIITGLRYSGVRYRGLSFEQTSNANISDRSYVGAIV